MTKFDGNGALVFSTFFGGTNGVVRPVDVDTDPSGQIVVGGNTTCTDLPTTSGVVQPTLVGGGSELLTDLSVAPTGEFAIAGQTAGLNWPGTPTALPPAFADQDAFVATFDPRSIPSYGTGSAGSGGYVPVLVGGGPTAPGTTTRLRIHDGLAQTLGALVAGFGRTNVPLFGGTQLVNPLSSLTEFLGGPPQTQFAARGGGYLHRGFAIPNNAGLVGVVIDWQAVFLDPQAVGGISLSNGVELVVQ